MYFFPAFSPGPAREVYKVCDGDGQCWPGASDGGQPNGGWAHRLRPLGGSHHRWMEGWGERGLGWPAGVDGDSLTDAGSLTPTSQVLLWLSRGTAALSVGSLENLRHAHGLLFFHLVIQIDTIIVLDCRNVDPSVLLFVPYLGFVSDWWQASKTSRSSGETGKHSQHQHAEETPAQFWTRHPAARHAGIRRRITMRRSCFCVHSPSLFRCATCRRAQLSWGRSMPARRPKPSRAASMRSCNPGRSCWLPARSAVSK